MSINFRYARIALRTIADWPIPPDNDRAIEIKNYAARVWENISTVKVRPAMDLPTAVDAMLDALDNGDPLDTSAVREALTAARSKP